MKCKCGGRIEVTLNGKKVKNKKDVVLINEKEDKRIENIFNAILVDFAGHVEKYRVDKNVKHLEEALDRKLMEIKLVIVGILEMKKLINTDFKFQN